MDDDNSILFFRPFFFKNKTLLCKGMQNFSALAVNCFLSVPPPSLFFILEEGLLVRFVRKKENE